MKTNLLDRHANSSCRLLSLVLVATTASVSSACSEIGPDAFDCEGYTDLAADEDSREQLELWARQAFQGEIIQSRALPAGYLPSPGPGDVRYENREDLGFLPRRGRDEWVELDLDSTGEVEAVFVGRSTRAGLVVFLRDVREQSYVKDSLIAEYGAVAVYCIE